MPQRKQPPTLRNMSMQKVREMLHDVRGRWIKNIRLAESLQHYDEQVEVVKKECQTVNKLLTSLPIHILDDLMPLVVSDFVGKLSAPCKDNWVYKRSIRFNNERSTGCYSLICKVNILTSVLLPSTKRLNIRTRSSCEQRHIIQTLNSTPNLTKLVFDTGVRSDNSSHLARNIHHLTQLVSFTYKFHCTDRVVEQLALHCRKLEEIDVSSSAAVTNASVEHLMKIKNLSDVNVMSTSITSESYGFLISELPKLANINSSFPICDVLNSISSESLHNITYINSDIYDSSMLTRKCPNITILKVGFVEGDLSSLAALNKLVELDIEYGDYLKSNMETVLQGVGHRLERLHLSSVKNVNMYDIVTRCSCLLSLHIDNCTTVPTEFYTTIRRDLPHFKSLNSLIIYVTPGSEVYNMPLGYYVNLEVFMCRGVKFLSDGFVDQAVKNGAFRSIKHFEVGGTDTGDLSMDTVRLLLDNCEHLKTLKGLVTWRLVTAENISHLISMVRLENLDLTIKGC